MSPLAGQNTAAEAFELTPYVAPAADTEEAERLDRAFDTAFHMSGVQAYLEYYQLQ